jgi:predicted phosphodiesterase
MPSSVDRVLILPDTHAPYHDERAWKLAIKIGRAFKPDTLVHMGDLADFYAVSSHSKDPTRAMSLKDEILDVRRLRRQMDSLGAERRIFIEGNHEDRLRRYLQDKAPHLFGLVSADELIQLSENGWEFIPYRKSAKVGKVWFTHDTGTAGKYSTARASETFQHSVVIGHHHAIQYHVAGDATGKYQVGAQFGWLGDISKVDYMHQIKVRRTWALGIGLGYHDKLTGAVYLTPVPFINYRACVEGRVFET